MTITVPTAPALAHLPGVELMQVGQWDSISGTHTFTADDLAAAVGALDCPAVRRPVLKLGHDGNHGIGEPAIGWVDNMATTDDGRTLIGDYVGMPGWFGDIIASAYPDRSIEGTSEFVCQLGHTHPFVVHAVALLGVERPAIGTLASLQDVAAIYGVTLEAQPSNGRPFALTVRQEAPVPPTTLATQVAAGVTTEDVRRKYYESASYSVWIEEMHLDPLQLIVIDDSTGKRSRIPIDIGDGDGDEAVSFGDAVPVVIRYEDAPSEVAAGAARAAVLAFATRAESRPGAPRTPVATSASGSTQEGNESMSDLANGLRQKLGIADENADEATLLAALDEALAEQADPPAATSTVALPEGIVAIDATALEELKVAAKAGQQAAHRFARDDRDRELKTAMGEGKFAPARLDHWQKLWDADPEGTRATLSALEKGLVPVVELGHGGGNEATDSDAEYRSLFPDEVKAV